MDVTPHFPIYLDYGATTPVDPRVVDAMIPWLREHFGNPASRSHAWGWEAEEAVEQARTQVAELINIGTLAAFIIICASILVLRVRQPELQRSFRTPAAWVVACRSRSANDVIAEERTGELVEGTKKLLSTRAEKRHDGERCQITGSRLEADHAAQPSPCCTLHRYGS